MLCRRKTSKARELGTDALLNLLNFWQVSVPLRTHGTIAQGIVLPIRVGHYNIITFALAKTVEIRLVPWCSMPNTHFSRGVDQIIENKYIRHGYGLFVLDIYRLPVCSSTK